MLTYKITYKALQVLFPFLINVDNVRMLSVCNDQYIVFLVDLKILISLLRRILITEKNGLHF